MPTVERSVESIRTSRREELTIVLVQLFGKRVLQDSADVFVDFECQVIYSHPWCWPDFRSWG